MIVSRRRDENTKREKEKRAINEERVRASNDDVL